jgi:hypothetical protein
MATSQIIYGSLSANTFSATTIYLGNNQLVGNTTFTGGTVTGQTSFTSGLTITGDTIITDSTGTSTAIDTSTRELVDSSALVSVDWRQRLLYDGAGNATIDYSSTLLYDSTSTPSVDWGNRQTYDDLGVLSIDWQYGRRRLYDVSSNESLDWDIRTLTKSDGTTVSFDWENGILTGQTNIESSTISATTISGSTLYGNLIDSKYLQTTVTVTAADFLGTAPGGTVKVLIPPVGAGKYLRLNTLVGKFKNATVAYNTMPALTVAVELGAFNNVVSLSSLGTTEEVVSTAGNGVSSGINGSVYLLYKLSGSTPTVGDGDLIFEIEYQILDF